MRHGQRDTLIIIPVHNRRETTLRCLRVLRDVDVLVWAVVVVVDDGSSDSTHEAVRAMFSEQDVVVIHGDGTLWWAGGINRGMEYAVQEGFDYLIWLNDDCVPSGNALRMLRDFSERHDAISIGQAQTPSGGWYGGYRKSLFGLCLVDVACEQSDVPCDTFAGNVVCMACSVAERTGFLDARRMPMSYGDLDYGLRAQYIGIQAYVVRDAVFENEDNMGPGYQSWLLGDYPVWSMWRSFFTIVSPVATGPRFCFFVRHWGPWGYVLAGHLYVRFWLMALVRLVIPRQLLRRAFGGRARMWRKYRYYEKIHN